MKVQELVEKLNAASAAYYNGEEIMSNYEYDRLYDELLKIEKETGIILPDSPTQKVGAVAVNELQTEKHEYPALSLDKTKNIDEFVNVFVKGYEAAAKAGYLDDGLVVLMWKEDGSTVQLTYQDGKLQKAVTRGNGEVGSVITHNAPYIKGIPMTIPYKGKLVVRGEAVMSYKEFERINQTLPEEEQYKNPRNLANASISMLDSRQMRQREICFKAFNMVYMEDMPANFYTRLALLYEWGFSVVENVLCSIKMKEYPMIEYLPYAMKRLETQVGEYEFPVDGLVCAFNNARYADTLPGTGHNPNVLRGYAFKWEDETAETVLRKIEWSASRTGLLNPVAVFEPVELEGTTVSRASLHNVSYIQEKKLVEEDRITVYKANKIIPQVADNLDAGKRDTIIIPAVFCPACGKQASIIKETSGTSVMKCMNKDCPAKMVGKFVHFAERDCMNIKGMSEETIEKFVNYGFIREFSDFWHLDRYRDEIIAMEGFGQKSYDKIIAAAEKARNTDFVSFVHALGIPNVGKGQAKLLAKHYHNDIRMFLLNQANDNLSDIEGIGEVIEKSIHLYLNYEMQGGFDRFHEVPKVFEELVFPEYNAEEVPEEKILSGKTFVITGEVHHFKNRAELQKIIEELGGKVTGSVSKATSYLINNDVESTSGKNKKAKELGISIISEDELLQMIK